VIGELAEGEGVSTEQSGAAVGPQYAQQLGGGDQPGVERVDDRSEHFIVDIFSGFGAEQVRQ
jgi:hypothetical protein